MNNEIKKRIEEYVVGELDYLNQLDHTDQECKSIKDSSIKNINTLIELLQKDDVIKKDYISDENKTKNEMTKIKNDYELNLKKIQCDIDRNKNESIKVNLDYEINQEKLKIETDKNKENSHLENRKIDNDEKKHNCDFDLKKKELDMNIKRDIENRNDRIIKVIIDGATILVPIIFYNVWMNKGFKFEETGTYTSNTFKNMFNRFKPTK